MRKQNIFFILITFILLIVTGMSIYAASTVKTRGDIILNAQNLDEISFAYTINNSTESNSNSFSLEYTSPGQSQTVNITLTNNSDAMIHRYYKIDSSCESGNEVLYSAILVSYNGTLIGTLNDLISSTTSSINDEYAIIDTKQLKSDGTYDTSTTTATDTIIFELHQAADSSLFDNKSINITLTAYAETADYEKYVVVSNEDEFAEVINDIESSLLTTIPTIILDSNIELSNAYTITNPITIQTNGYTITNSSTIELNDEDALITILGSGKIKGTVTLTSYDSVNALVLITEYASNALANGIKSTDTIDILGPYYSIYNPTTAVTSSYLNYSSTSLSVSNAPTYNKEATLTITLNSNTVEIPFKVIGTASDIDSYLTHIPSNDDIISWDLFLPTSIPGNDAVITWSSSNESIISNTGKINVSSSIDKKEVTLYATIKVNNYLVTRTYTFYVSANNNEVNFQKLVNDISPLIITKKYVDSNSSDSEATNSTIYYLPTVDTSSSYDYRKSYGTPYDSSKEPEYDYEWTIHNDINLKSLEYSYFDETTYSYIKIGDDINSNYSETYLNNMIALTEDTLSNYAKIKVIGTFDNGEKCESIINISIALGSDTELLEKAFNEVDNELDKISVLGNIIDTRKNSGVSNESGDFYLPTVYSSDSNYTMSYSISTSSSIITLEVDSSSNKVKEYVKDSEGNFTEKGDSTDTTSVTYNKFIVDLTKLKSVETSVPVEVTATYGTVAKTKTIYVNTPAAVHISDLGNISIFNSLKYQVMTSLTNENVTASSSDTSDYILLRDIVGDKSYLEDYASDDYYLEVAGIESEESYASGVTSITLNTLSDSSQYSSATDSLAYDFVKLISWATSTDNKGTTVDNLELSNTTILSSYYSYVSNGKEYLSDNELAVIKYFYQTCTGDSDNSKWESIKSTALETAPGRVYDDSTLLTTVLECLTSEIGTNSGWYEVESSGAYSKIYAKYLEILNRYATTTSAIEESVAPAQEVYNSKFYYKNVDSISTFYTSDGSSSSDEYGSNSCYYYYDSDDSKYYLAIPYKDGYLVRIEIPYSYYSDGSSSTYRSNNSTGSTKYGYWYTSYSTGDYNGAYRSDYESDKTKYITDAELTILKAFWLGALDKTTTTNVIKTFSDDSLNKIKTVLTSNYDSYYNYTDSDYSTANFDTYGEAIINALDACLVTPTYFTSNGIGLLINSFYENYNYSSTSEDNSLSTTSNKYDITSFTSVLNSSSTPTVSNLDNLEGALSYFTNLKELTITGTSSVSAFLSEYGLSTAFARITLNNSKLTKLTLNYVADNEIEFDLTNIKNLKNLTTIDISNNQGITSVMPLLNVNRNSYESVNISNIGEEYEYNEFVIDYLGCSVTYTDANDNIVTNDSSASSILVNLSDIEDLVSEHLYLTNVIYDEEGNTTSICWRIEEGNEIYSSEINYGSELDEIDSIREMILSVSPYFYCETSFTYKNGNYTNEFVAGVLYEVTIDGTAATFTPLNVDTNSNITYSIELIDEAPSTDYETNATEVSISNNTEGSTTTSTKAVSTGTIYSQTVNADDEKYSIYMYYQIFSFKIYHETSASSYIEETYYLRSNSSGNEITATSDTTSNDCYFSLLSENEGNFIYWLKKNSNNIDSTKMENEYEIYATNLFYNSEGTSSSITYDSTTYCYVKNSDSKFIEISDSTKYADSSGTTYTDGSDIYYKTIDNTYVKATKEIILLGLSEVNSSTTYTNYYIYSTYQSKFLSSSGLVANKLGDKFTLTYGSGSYASGFTIQNTDANQYLNAFKVYIYSGGTVIFFASAVFYDSIGNNNLTYDRNKDQKSYALYSGYWTIESESAPTSTYESSNTSFSISVQSNLPSISYETKEGKTYYAYFYCYTIRNARTSQSSYYYYNNTTKTKGSTGYVYDNGVKLMLTTSSTQPSSNAYYFCILSEDDQQKLEKWYSNPTDNITVGYNTVYDEDGKSNNYMNTTGYNNVYIYNPFTKRYVTGVKTTSKGEMYSTSLTKPDDTFTLTYATRTDYSSTSNATSDITGYGYKICFTGNDYSNISWNAYGGISANCPAIAGYSIDSGSLWVFDEVGEYKVNDYNYKYNYSDYYKEESISEKTVAYSLSYNLYKVTSHIVKNEITKLYDIDKFYYLNQDITIDGTTYKAGNVIHFTYNAYYGYEYEVDIEYYTVTYTYTQSTETSSESKTLTDISDLKYVYYDSSGNGITGTITYNASSNINYSAYSQSFTYSINQSSDDTTNTDTTYYIESVSNDTTSYIKCSDTDTLYSDNNGTANSSSKYNSSTNNYILGTDQEYHRVTDTKYTFTENTSGTYYSDGYNYYKTSDTTATFYNYLQTSSNTYSNEYCYILCTDGNYYKVSSGTAYTVTEDTTSKYPYYKDSTNDIYYQTCDNRFYSSNNYDVNSYTYVKADDDAYYDITSCQICQISATPDDSSGSYYIISNDYSTDSTNDYSTDSTNDYSTDSTKATDTNTKYTITKTSATITFPSIKYTYTDDTFSEISSNLYVLNNDVYTKVDTTATYDSSTTYYEVEYTEAMVFSKTFDDLVENGSLYTLSDTSTYTKLDTTATYDSSTTYYTRGIDTSSTISNETNYMYYTYNIYSDEKGTLVDLNATYDSSTTYYFISGYEKATNVTSANFSSLIETLYSDDSGTPVDLNATFDASATYYVATYSTEKTIDDASGNSKTITSDDLKTYFEYFLYRLYKKDSEGNYYRVSEGESYDSDYTYYKEGYVESTFKEDTFATYKDSLFVYNSTTSTYDSVGDSFSNGTLYYTYKLISISSSDITKYQNVLYADKYALNKVNITDYYIYDDTNSAYTQATSYVSGTPYYSISVADVTSETYEASKYYIYDSTNSNYTLATDLYNNNETYYTFTEASFYAISLVENKIEPTGDNTESWKESGVSVDILYSHTKLASNIEITDSSSKTTYKVSSDNKYLLTITADSGSYYTDGTNYYKSADGYFYQYDEINGEYSIITSYVDNSTYILLEDDTYKLISSSTNYSIKFTSASDSDETKYYTDGTNYYLVSSDNSTTATKSDELDDYIALYNKISSDSTTYTSDIYKYVGSGSENIYSNPTITSKYEKVTTGYVTSTNFNELKSALYVKSGTNYASATEYNASTVYYTLKYTVKSNLVYSNYSFTTNAAYGIQKGDSNLFDSSNKNILYWNKYNDGVSSDTSISMDEILEEANLYYQAGNYVYVTSVTDTSRTYYNITATRVETTTEPDTNTIYYTKTSDGSYIKATGITSFDSNTTYYTLEASESSSTTNVYMLTTVNDYSEYYGKYYGYNGFTMGSDSEVYAEVTVDTTTYQASTYYTYNLKTGFTKDESSSITSNTTYYSNLKGYDNNYIYKIIDTGSGFAWLRVSSYSRLSGSNMVTNASTGSLSVGDIVWATSTCFGSFYTGSKFYKIVDDDLTGVNNVVQFNDVTISANSTYTDIENAKIQYISESDYLGYAGTYEIVVSAVIRDPNGDGDYSDNQVKTYKIKLVGTVIK